MIIETAKTSAPEKLKYGNLTLSDVVKMLGQAALDNSGTKDGRVHSGSGVRKLMDVVIEEKWVKRSPRTSLQNLLLPFKEELLPDGRSKPSPELPPKNPHNSTRKIIKMLLDHFEVYHEGKRVQFASAGEVADFHAATYPLIEKRVLGDRARQKDSLKQAIALLEAAPEEKVLEVINLLQGEGNKDDTARVDALYELDEESRAEFIEEVTLILFKQMEELQAESFADLAGKLNISEVFVNSFVVEARLPDDRIIFLENIKAVAPNLLEKPNLIKEEAMDTLNTLNTLGSLIRRSMVSSGLEPRNEGDIEEFLDMCSFAESQGNLRQQSLEAIANGANPPMACAYPLFQGLKQLNPEITFTEVRQMLLRA